MKKLRDYQEKAVEYLYIKKKALLLMGCRTGKTFTALSAAETINQVDGKKNKCVLPVYVLGPVNTEEVWMNEWNSCNHSYPLCFLSPFRKQSHQIPKKSILIIDECQLYMHDYNKQASIIEMAKKAEYVFMLSATPLTNSPINLYWPLKICGVHDWSKKDYIIEFMGGKQHKFYPNIVYPTGVTNIERLKEWKEECSFSYFRKELINKTDYFLGEAPIETSSTLENYSLMQNVLGVAKSNDKKVLNKLLDLIYRPTIVFYRHLSVGKKLKTFLSFSKGVNQLFYISGKDSVNTRLKTIQGFLTSRKRFKVLLVSVDVGGVGLDIPADCVIFFERTWSPTKDYQAYMRAYGFNRETTLDVNFLNYTDEARYQTNKKKKILEAI